MASSGLRLAALAMVFVLQEPYDPKKPLAPDVLLLARIKVVASEDFAHLPNFTCVETIERSQRLAPTKKFQLLDNIRLEVALVGGKELYAWPGATRFEERDLRDMVGGGGSIGTGDFALHARAIYFSNTAVFRYEGQEDLNGHKTHRFHYHIPMNRSGFTMRIPPTEGIVGYQGTVWHDIESLELVRLEMIIDEIPPQVPLASGFKRIDYARLPIGGQKYLLPTSMDMTLFQLSGLESRNRTVFTNCKQYVGESTLTFEELGDVKPAEAHITVTLPAGLPVPLKLQADYEMARAARGDLVKFLVTKDVTRKGELLLPKGAEVEFRVDAVICGDAPVAHCFLGLKPERFSFENKSGEFLARMELPTLTDAIKSTGQTYRYDAARTLLSIPPPPDGTSMLFVRGAKGKLPSGYPTTWRTLEVQGEAKP